MRLIWARTDVIGIKEMNQSFSIDVYFIIKPKNRCIEIYSTQRYYLGIIGSSAIDLYCSILSEQFLENLVNIPLLTLIVLVFLSFLFIGFILNSGDISKGNKKDEDIYIHFVLRTIIDYGVALIDRFCCLFALTAMPILDWTNNCP